MCPLWSVISEVTSKLSVSLTLCIPRGSKSEGAWVPPLPGAWDGGPWSSPESLFPLHLQGLSPETGNEPMSPGSQTRPVLDAELLGVGWQEETEVGATLVAPPPPRKCCGVSGAQAEAGCWGI